MESLKVAERKLFVDHKESGNKPFYTVVSEIFCLQIRYHLTAEIIKD